jgi:quercetin dioxygenase-like cupin family protein
LLIDRDNVGSEKLVLNYFALKPDKKTDQGSHPAPFDEVYYVLRGFGILYLGESQEAYELEPDSVAFIPHNTLHFVINNSPEELEMITIMPGPIEEGANFVYDQRKREWGTSFMLNDSISQKGEL